MCFSQIVAIFSFLLLLIHSGSSQLNGIPSLSSCTANGGVPGRCTQIRKCSDALGYLRSNVTLPSCNTRDPRIVCCPVGKRISEMMCEKYKEVLKNPTSFIPLLPGEFLDDEEPAEVTCDPNTLKNPLVSGGRDAAVDEMPFMVALGYNVSNIPWRCGGTLISDQYVLTAAHCVVNQYAGPPIKLLLGDITLSSSNTTAKTRQIVGVSKVFVHPNYRPPLTYHDIALVKLDRKISFSKSIMPACLPQAKDDMLRDIAKKIFTASGFGVTGAGEGQSDALQVVNLNGFHWDACNAFYREISTWNIKFPQGITRTQICAGDSMGRKDTCQGDSGGPLLLPDTDKRCVYRVAGVTSFGPNQCGERAPAVYSNVMSYLDWIEDVVWRTN